MSVFDHILSKNLPAHLKFSNSLPTPFGLSIFSLVSSFSKSLVHIGLRSCQLQGQIPDAFTNMASLVSLDLSDYQLQGHPEVSSFK
ncbi:hypothetical protein TIFTF001_013410 [Ficus carica]|uniref:Uncharacterized protein n=1 Tax=Ficus carica TaxID=3494 RepID=A0AA88A1X9_FICCA|nr:hypothetical protein TIFTF001_013410 [Ficus carica]